jgi:hypothetical protein
MTDDAPHVRYEPDRGWICSCTGVWIERIDFDLDCHHWPLCEHVVAAARKELEKVDVRTARIDDRTER